MSQGVVRIAAQDIAEDLRRVGMYRVDILEGDSYRDMSVCMICPTRGGKPKDWKRPNGEPAEAVGMIPDVVHQSIMNLQRPPNHPVAARFVRGDEVGRAYNRGIRSVLDDPHIGKFAWILTHEDDNILPPSGLLCLLQTAFKHQADVVAGLYYMKGPMAVPMAFGRPGQTDAAGGIDFTPRDLTEAIVAANSLEETGYVVPVNGVACGFTLWRMDLFREFAYPWFTTFTRFDNNGVIEAQTQDIFWCKKLVEAGKKLVVDCRVRVGHLDVESGAVY